MPVATAFCAPVQTGIVENKQLVYLVSDQRIPFWDIMWRGIKSRAEELGYKSSVYSSDNDAKQEIQFAVKAIKERVAGIVVSPTNSSACVTILKLAKSAGIPVVIADIGTDGGEYVSYISSDNREGAYKIGKVLAEKMHALNWQDGRVGIIAIPQKRANGQARTAGFMLAMKEAGIKGAGIWQQETFSYQETYDFSKRLIEENSDLRAIWLQGSDRYQGAIDAITDAGKNKEILLITFDAEPVFLELIPDGILLGAGMQQPFLMGEKAVDAMHAHLTGQIVIKEQKLPVLAVSAMNIKQKLPLIHRNVLGMDSQ
ncbi:substrate-binding domain-containing protein [Mariprofundus sp. KV]|uniref:substrate-binding domain-containing protein n=1 Tax=Mariprofundus sp. KV TaxID=2608715 RepID=UPI0015A28086|nr:substrate-binding domain-containing protein [Mariprofundus sp. KV]NWF35687.1 substrate-binding domain-containing protein [Mariprofundus sp. KV]